MPMETMVNGGGEGGDHRTPKLPPATASSSGGGGSLRKSIIKISSSNSRVDSEQVEKNSSHSSTSTTTSTTRTRVIPVLRANSNYGDHPPPLSSVRDSIGRPFTPPPSASSSSFAHSFKVPSKRINLIISSQSDAFSRAHSLLNGWSPLADIRCASPGSSSGYESTPSSIYVPPTPTSTPEIRVRRTSSANRLYFGRQQSQPPPPSSPSSPQSYNDGIKSSSSGANAAGKSPPTTIKTKRHSFNENQQRLNADDIVKTLDKVEKRVSFFREIAFELFDEKNKLLDALSQIRSRTRLDGGFSEADLQDIQATTEVLLHRISSVDIHVNPVRTPDQLEAFDRAKNLVDRLNVVLNQEGIQAAKKQCLSYISSCTSNDSFDSMQDKLLGPIDERFQKIVIECSLEDQKAIKKRLKTFLERVETGYKK